jgi:hypothetical protein
MASVVLVHPQETRQVSGLQLITKCDLFRNDLTLVVSPYNIKSSVFVEDFREFVSAIEDRPIKITVSNISGLSLLSKEFGFESLTENFQSLSS